MATQRYSISLQPTETVVRGALKSLAPYPAYRAARVGWLGNIPAHWLEKRGKAFFREVDERSASGDEELLSVSHTTGVTPRSQKNVTMFKAESYVGHKLARPGDIVVNTMWAWMAALGVAKQTGIVSPSYGVYRPLNDQNFNAAFLDYLLRIPNMKWEYVCRSKGIRTSRLRLYADQFLDTVYPCPPREEQDRIVSFLRAKDSDIRRLIRNKRRLIELLIEQKQGIINRLVTYGVNTQAPIKATGIDWMPAIPAHWEMKRLKTLVRNVTEQTNSMASDETYIALEHVKSWSGDVAPPGDDIVFESQVKRFREGDILFGKLRPYLAKVTRATQKGVCVGEFLVLRPATNEILGEFLEQKLRSRSVIDLINSSVYGAKMPRAEWNFIGNVRFAFPREIDEQRKIMRFISEETRTLDKAVSRTEREIALINEYRERLVADVVTGKIDVRDVEISISEDGVLFEGIDNSEDVQELDQEELTESAEAELMEDADVDD